VLPVDVLALRRQIGLAAAGALNEALVVRERQTAGSDRHSLAEPVSRIPVEECVSGVALPRFNDGRQVVALDVLRDEMNETPIVLVQTRDPWALELQVLDGEMDFDPELDNPELSTSLSVSLPGSDRRDTGSDLFHEDSGLGIACASCHPEGSDDAQVWEFAGLGVRRTPQLSGGILAETAPFHWIGDMNDFSHLSHEVFSSRMGGPELPPEYVARMASWIDTIEPPKPSNQLDAEQVARGAAVFYSSETGCVSCHSGGFFTNNETVDVGTGLALQVPPLVGLDGRSGFMHTGCADTLMDRFTDEECGGGDRHGKTSHLDDAQLNDLVAFLRTL